MRLAGESRSAVAGGDLNNTEWPAVDGTLGGSSKCKEGRGCRLLTPYQTLALKALEDQ